MNNNFGHFDEDCSVRRERLLQSIRQAIEKLTLEELEALHYDMATKNYIND